MRIVSWNVNGIRTIIKKDFIESIKNLNSDILCLQETKAQAEEVKKVLMPISNYTIYCNSAEKKGYSGTALLYKNKPDSIETKNLMQGENEGRLICAEYFNFYLLNVYAPNVGQELEILDYKKSWNALFQHLIDYNSILIIIIFQVFL